MKLAIIVACICFTGVISLPLKEPRWVLVPDGEGHMHLVDLNPIEDAPVPAYDPMTDVVYWLFTRQNPTQAQVITHDMASVRNSNFNPNNELRIHTHGWGGGGHSGSGASVRNAWLAHADHNVLIIDWGAGAGTNNYVAARNRVGPTGQAAAVLLNNMVASGFASYNRTIVSGHSLGGHVAGHVGKAVGGQRIKAIFGLDPAGPLFQLENPHDRFDRTDAAYTEAILTNAGSLGFDVPIAHASFYPNWGTQQPGCLPANADCHHQRASPLFVESISSPCLVGIQCASYDDIVAQNCPGTGLKGVLGGDAPKNIEGVFYLETRAESPFGMGC